MCLCVCVVCMLYVLLYKPVYVDSTEVVTLLNKFYNANTNTYVYMHTHVNTNVQTATTANMTFIKYPIFHAKGILFNQAFLDMRYEESFNIN